MKYLILLTVLFGCCCLLADEQNDRGYKLLREMGGLSSDKVAAKIVQLSLSQDADSRMLAASIIGYWPYENQFDVYVKVLGKLLKDESLKVRIEAVGACPILGEKAGPLLPLISELKTSEDKTLREMAKAVYSQIEGFVEMRQQPKKTKNVQVKQ